MVLLTAISFAICFQEPSSDSVESMIRKLGSRSFAEREEAKKWLLARPTLAAERLRQATGSSDLEVARRSAWILKEIDNLPLREIQTAVKEKQIERAFRLLARFPAGKNEPGAWGATGDLTRLLLDLHKKKTGLAIDLTSWFEKQSRIPYVLAGPRVVIPSMRELAGKNIDGGVFLRAEKLIAIKEATPTCVIITSGAVQDLQASHSGLRGSVILAGGSVKTDNNRDMLTCVIVSFGDVTVPWMGNCLVIAKGKVTCTGPVYSCQIISGKTVHCRSHKNSIITENETAPLGLTRFFEKPPQNSGKKDKSSTSEK